jgi:hypothetical protein
MSVSQIDEITRLAKKHGFALGGMRSFERAVTREHIDKVREAARKARDREQKRLRRRQIARWGNGNSPAYW